MKKYYLIAAAILGASIMFTACSDNDDNKGNNNQTDKRYSDKSYGNSAIDACNDLVDALTKATGFTPSQKGDAWVLSGESDGTKITIVVNFNEAAGKFSAITLGGTDTEGMEKILNSFKLKK